MLGHSRVLSLGGLILLISAAALPQRNLSPREAALMLATPVQVSGTVFDHRGEPVQHAAIFHLADASANTGDTGHFSFSTRVPTFVIREPGFDGYFLRSSEAHDVRVVLKPSSGSFPRCSGNDQRERIEGWSTVFRFPKIQGITAEEQINDVDYGSRFYSIDDPSGLPRRGILHGAGLTWSVGAPRDEDVWSSVQYSERTFLWSDYRFVDARGATKEGRFWRYIGHFGESAMYWDVDEKTKAQLDRELDGVCIQSSHPNSAL